jgi:hypothetical protein
MLKSTNASMMAARNHVVSSLHFSNMINLKCHISPVSLQGEADIGPDAEITIGPKWTFWPSNPALTPLPFIANITFFFARHMDGKGPFSSYLIHCWPSYIIGREPPSVFPPTPSFHSFCCASQRSITNANTFSHNFPINLWIVQIYCSHFIIEQTKGQFQCFLKFCLGGNCPQTTFLVWVLVCISIES